MDCSCHGEPAYWQKDARSRGGGRWECAVRRRARQQALYDNEASDYRARKLQQQRDRYDADAVYRIRKLLHDDKQRRAKSVKRRKELHGEVPD